MTDIVMLAFKAPECPCGGKTERGSGSCITGNINTKVHTMATCECGIEMDFTFYIPNEVIEKYRNRSV